MKFSLGFFLSFIAFFLASGQVSDRNRFAFDEAPHVIKVWQNGDTLKNPWTGGLNYGHVNTIDLNNDGVEDLLVYERSGNRVLPYLKVSNGSSPYYKYSPQYSSIFPKADTWMLARDFNCDGKKDLFFGLTGGIVVWENTSTAGSELTFTPAHTTLKLKTQYSVGQSNLPVTRGDVPGIEDIDGDGNIDILTFENLGTRVEWHRNKANCGLDFEMQEVCWGHFREAGLSNTILLDSCTPGKFKTMHTGSTLLPIDLDGDNVYELLLGDISFKNIVAVFNDGTASAAHMYAQDTTFPVYDTPVDVNLYPAAFYEDVDHDGARDLLVSPNDPSNPLGSNSKNYNSLYYYKNIGTDSNPNFNFQKDNFLFEDMMDFGEGCVPRLVDIDNDMLLDLIVANGYYNQDGASPRFHAYAYYRNTGSATNPEFTLIDSNFIDISSFNLGFSSIPTFGDLNSDGLKDMLVGDENGNIHYFTNNGSTSNPSFALAQPGINNIDVGSNAAPFLFDIDGDGDLDLVVGRSNGRLDYYSNSSSSSPNFTLDNSFFGGVDVRTQNSIEGFSIPYVFEANGLINLMVASEADGVFHFDSINDVLNSPSNIKGQIGSGSIVSTNDDETPFGTGITNGTRRRSGRNQILVRANELKAQGLKNGFITTIHFETNITGSITIQNGVNIKMLNTQDSVLTDFINSQTTTVKSDLSPIALGSGWNAVFLDTPFLWDGTSNLLIEVCFSANPNSATIPVLMEDAGFSANAYGDVTNYNTISSNGCAMPFLAATNMRPNLKFDLTPAFLQSDQFLGNGFRNAAAFGDLNGDGYVDAIVGNYSGGLAYHQGKVYDVSLPENPALANRQLKIFPNPNGGLFTISFNSEEAAEFERIEIFNLSGQLIQTTEVDQQEIDINLASYPKGLYLVRAASKTGFRTGKVLIK